MLVSSKAPSAAHNGTWRLSNKSVSDIADVADVTNVTWGGYDITQDVSNVTDDVREYGSATDILSDWNGQIAVTSWGYKPNRSTTATLVEFPDDYGWISPYESPNSSVTWGVLVAIIVVVVCFFVAVVLYARYRRACSVAERMDDTTNGPPSEQTEIMIENNSYDYIYKPVSGTGALDDEYETTFVGVSIPLLQEVTRI